MLTLFLQNNGTVKIGFQSSLLNIIEYYKKEQIAETIIGGNRK